MKERKMKRIEEVIEDGEEGQGKRILRDRSSSNHIVSGWMGG
jgi:hypothetical protein